MKRRKFQPFAIIFLGAIFLSWPALYNGYPFIFPDTSAYLSVVIDLLEKHWLSPSWARPPFYGFLVFPMHFMYSLWPIVLVQGFIVAHLVYLALRVLFGTVNLTRFLVVIAVLSVGSALPWHVSTLIPDVFAPIVILGAFVLIYGYACLNLWERIYLLFIVAAAISTHFSHIPLAAFVFALGVVLVIVPLTRRSVNAKGVALLGLAALLAVSSLVAINKITRDQASVSTHGNLFILNRYQGLIKKYLEENCASEKYALCNHMDYFEPRPGGLLWGKDSLVESVGANVVARESKEVLVESFKADPLSYLVDVAKKSLAQMMLFSTASWIYPLASTDEPGDHPLFQHFQDEYHDFLSARQTNEKIPRDLINLVHVPLIFMLYPVFLFFAYLAYRKGQERVLGLFLFVFVGLIGNAFFMSTFSWVVGRYHSRVVWLVIFAVMVAICEIQNKKVSMV